jgi:hypothetical protein
VPLPVCAHACIVCPSLDPFAFEFATRLFPASPDMPSVDLAAAANASQGCITHRITG